ncbi:hypothetical protein FDZ84_10670 [Saccharopolyspora sp. ASAGF58]|nr:hypothetical protein FDZ84_10670 [Saccharopolyspora sp. ASAGF58]
MGVLSSSGPSSGTSTNAASRHRKLGRRRGPGTTTVDGGRPRTRCVSSDLRGCSGPSDTRAFPSSAPTVSRSSTARRWSTGRRGETFRRSWPPVRTRTSARRDGRRSWDVAFCGHCGGKLYITGTDNRDGRSRKRYGCISRRKGVDCPGPALYADLLEPWVEKKFLRAVGRMMLIERIDTAGEDHRAEIADLKAQLSRLREHGRKGLYDDAPEEFATAVGALQRRLKDLESRPTETTVEERITGETYAQRWASDGTKGKRNTLISAGVRVELAPGRKGSKAWEDRLTFDMRGAPRHRDGRPAPVRVGRQAWPEMEGFPVAINPRRAGHGCSPDTRGGWGPCSRPPRLVRSTSHAVGPACVHGQPLCDRPRRLRAELRAWAHSLRFPPCALVLMFGELLRRAPPDLVERGSRSGFLHSPGDPAPKTSVSSYMRLPHWVQTQIPSPSGW